MQKKKINGETALGNRREIEGKKWRRHEQKKEVEKEQFQMKKIWRRRLKWEWWKPDTHINLGEKAGLTLNVHSSIPPCNEMKSTSRGGGWLKHLAVELFIHLETWIQQEENPNPECACWEGQGVMCESARSGNASASVEGRRICQSWAYLWFSLKNTVSWRKVSDCWIWGCRGQPGYPGCGKRAWVGFGVWFYSPHKVIWIHWWCDGVLPESTALFLQKILCLAKCLGVRVRPWVPPRLGAPCPVLQNTKFQVSQSSVCMAGNSLLDVTRAGGGFGLGFHGNNRLNSD